MRIALFTPDLCPSAGGPPRVVLQSARALAARGHAVTIFTFAHDASAIDGVDVVVHAIDFPGALGRSRAMQRDMSTRIDDFDVLHVHAIWEVAAAQLGTIFARAQKPVFVSAHGMLDRWSMRQSRLKKQLVLRCLWTRRLFAICTSLIFATGGEAGEAAGIASDVPRSIIPNGIDPAETVADVARGAAAFHARLPQVAAWPRTIIYLSRLHPKKGVDQLIEARLQLSPEFDDVGLLIVGIAQDASLLRAIEVRIANSPLANRFALTTDLVGPSALAGLGVAQLFTLPSHQEGFSIAILEAMAAGLPVLITNKCHLPEIEDWRAGAVVPDTVAGLRAGLERLLALSPYALGEMGKRAEEAVTAHFSWPIIAERLETLYCQRRSQ